MATFLIGMLILFCASIGIVTEALFEAPLSAKPYFVPGLVLSVIGLAYTAIHLCNRMRS